MTTPKGNVRKHAHITRTVATRPGEAEVSKVIGSKGLKNLGGRVQEEYDKLLTSWSDAVQYYIEMRDDLTISTLMQAIKLPLLAADFDVEPASDSLADVAAKDWLWDAMNNMDRQTWRSHVSDMLEAPEFGWAIGEIVLEKRRDGRLWLKNIDPRGQETLHRWEFDEFDHTKAFTQKDPDTGRIATIPMQKTVHVTFGGRKGNPQGRGMFRVLFRTWRFLKNLENLEGIGLERNIGGMPVATLPTEPLSDADIEDLKAALRDLRLDEEMYMILPNGLTVSAYSGSINTAPLSLVIDRKQKEILQLGFAQFIKLGMSTVGTQALVKGSQDFFTLGLESVQQQILEAWNGQLVPFLFRFNEFSFPGMTGFPKITWHQPGKVDIVAVLDAYNKALTAKVMTPIKEDEEFFRAELDLADLPEGVGDQDRSGGDAAGGSGPPSSPFSRFEDLADFHPGHPDQSIHAPKGGRRTSGGGQGLLPQAEVDNIMSSVDNIYNTEGDFRDFGHKSVGQFFPGSTPGTLDADIVQSRNVMNRQFMIASDSPAELASNNNMYDGWQRSSIDEPGAQQFQESVAILKEGSNSRFDSDLEATSRSRQVESTPEESQSRSEGVGRALEVEQEFWKEKLGPDGTLTVYRGVNLPENERLETGSQGVINDFTVSSWSANPVVASGYGNTVVARKVKPEDIVGSFATRDFPLGEHEIMTYNPPEGIDVVAIPRFRSRGISPSGITLP